MASKMETRWSEVKNYADLLQTNADYVRGYISSSPYCNGSVQVDNPTALGKLYELHKYGILTSLCQEARCHYGQYIDAEWEENGIKKGKWFEDLEKRNYLCFYVNLMKNADLATSLLARLQDSDLIFTGVNLSNDTIYTTIPPANVGINLVQVKTSLHREKLEGAPWSNVLVLNRKPNIDKMKWIGIGGSVTRSGSRSNPNISGILKRTMCFVVASADFCQNEVLDKVLEMCNLSGATKIGLDPPPDKKEYLAEKRLNRER